MHRVVNRSATVTRHSIVFFCNADYDALVETIELPNAAQQGSGCSGSGSDAAAAAAAGRHHRYPPIKAGEYMMARLAGMHHPD